MATQLAAKRDAVAGKAPALPPANTNSAASAPVLDSGEELNRYRWIILVGLITAAILEVLDGTIVNVALPSMAGNLGATREEIAWVSTGYILSNVIVLPMTAWLSSLFGRKRYLTGSILLFILASLLCGTSRSLGELVLWRIVQGAGGAALLSTAQATLREIFPREQQGTVQSIYVLGVIVAPTIGPTLGGYITDNLSWPWIFLVNIPIGLISAAIVIGFLNDSKHKVASIKVDLPGIAMLAVGLGSLQYVLEEGNQNGWFEDGTITFLAVVAAITLTALILWEMYPGNASPVINLRVLKNRDLTTALVLFLALGFGLYGGTFIFPLFAQNILGFTPTVTGLVLMPGGIGTGVAAILCGQLLNGKKQLVNPRYLIICGMTLFVISMWDLGHMTTQSGEPDTRIALLLRGAGLGMLFTPINLAAFSSLRGVEIAQGASMLNLMRQLGGSFGIAILSTYLTNDTVAHYTDLTSHAYLGNPLFDDRVRMLGGAFSAHGYDAASAHQSALGLVAQTMQTQALTMSYNDAFLMIGISVVMVSPLIFLLRTSRPAAPAAAVDAH